MPLAHIPRALNLHAFGKRRADANELLGRGKWVAIYAVSWRRFSCGPLALNRQVRHWSPLIALTSNESDATLLGLSGLGAFFPSE